MLTASRLAVLPEFKPMTASLAPTLPAGSPQGILLPRAAAAPGVPRSGGLLPWAAFHLLCLWTRSDPESVARLLGVDGFDADFGLGDRG